MPFTIQNGTLTLTKSDPGLESLALFFDVLLNSNTCVISNAQQAPAVNNQATISGQTTALGGTAQAELTYAVDSGALLLLKLVQPLDEFDGLALPNIVTFSALQHHVHITAPAAGSSDFADLWHELSGTITLGSTSTAIDFTIANPVSSQAMLIETAFAPDHAPGLADLVRLFHADAATDASTDLAWLPEDLRQTELLTLRDMAFKIDPGEASGLSMIKVTIDLARGEFWPIIPGSRFLSIGDLWITIEVDYPLDAAYRFPSVQFGGSIKIGQLADDGVIAVAARWPDFAISGGLPAGQSIHLSRLLDELTLPLADLPTGQDEFVIDTLAFRAEPTMTPQRYSFAVDILNLWTIALPGGKTLSLARLSLFLDYTGANGQASSTTTAMLLGVLRIAGADVTVSANHLGADSGWAFSGSTGPGQMIAIDGVTAPFGDTTPPAVLDGVWIENLQVAFKTKKLNFSFTGAASMRIHGTDLAISLAIEVAQGTDGYTTKFGGWLMLGDLRFELHFSVDRTSDLFVATYSHSAAQQSIRVKDLIAAVSADTAAAIPDSLMIDLKDVLFVFRKQASGEVFLFGMDLGAAINLSQLPTVGQAFSADQTLVIEDLQLLIASQPLKVDDVTQFNALFPTGVTRLPLPPVKNDAAASLPTAPAAPPAIQSGLTLAAVLKMGGTPAPLMLPITPDQGSNSAAMTPANTSGAAPVVDNTRWFVIQRSFGPVSFARIGVQYKDATAWFLLDAALNSGGLSLALDGLAVGSPLNQFAPTFSLRGMAIAYTNPTMTLAGALLRVPRIGSDGVPYDEYAGAALLKTSKLTLSALGSYAYLNGYPSLFVYATLDAPIGGPSFFFVTGLAAGFGYNRALRSPAIEEIPQFPLIQAAAAGPRPSLGDSTQLMQELNRIGQTMPPAVGQYFFAVGITFTSFKIIDSVALLTVSVGDHTAIEVLGLSTMIAPTPTTDTATVTPLTEVRMAVKATFLPAEGFLGVRAQLTGDSYILSRACRLTGGAAFYCWFSGDNAGDFVFTLGGYHTRYTPPPHYPRVPRLGLNWQVNEQLAIKGQGYFALTAGALMAGGQFEITWQSSNLKVWFGTGADFLLAWKPYYYEASAYIQLRVEYTFEFWGTHRLSFDVGASLKLWGPEFSGTAHIQLSILSFDIAFGGAAAQPKPIDWNAFANSFLPHSADQHGVKTIAACSIAVQDGLVRAMPQPSGAADLWVINPQHVVFAVQSAIPSSTAQIRSHLDLSRINYSDAGSQATAVPFRADDVNAAFSQATTGITRQIGAVGVAPMALLPGSVSVSFSVRITRNGAPFEHAFSFTPILKNVPSALWGTKLTPSLHDPSMIADTFSGFEVRQKDGPTTGASETLATSQLLLAATEISDAYAWPAAIEEQLQPGDDAARRTQITAALADQAVQTARTTLLAALGVNTDVTLGENIAGLFLAVPEVVTTV